MDQTALIIIGIVVVGLIAFIIMRNIKDKRELEQKIKDDYPRPREHKEDFDSDELKK